MDAEAGHIGWLGFIIFAIVVGSLGCIVLAALCGRPWKPRVTLLVMVTLGTLTTTLILGMWVGGRVFALLMG
jgi:hypothetical protein